MGHGWRSRRFWGWLETRETGGLSHGDLQARLQVDARELFRRLLQDHSNGDFPEYRHYHLDQEQHGNSRR